MKKSITYLLIVFAIAMNTYLIFYWNPRDIQCSTRLNESIESEVSSDLYLGNKQDIEKNLSHEDRSELDKILCKLSTIDMGRVQECFKISNDNTSLIEGFKILKTRLSSNNYERIREIYSKFIDIKHLDEELEKVNLSYALNRSILSKNGYI